MNKTKNVSIYLSIKDFEKEKIETLKKEIIEAIKQILAKDEPPKDISITFVWY